MLHHRMPLLLALALAPMLAGCGSFDDELSRELFDQLMASELDVLAWAAAWRSFVFGGLGLGLGLGLFFALRSRALLRLNWQHAKWVRALAGVLIVLSAAGTGAWWGFWTGTLRGAQAVIRDGQFGTELLPVAGEAGSLLLASVYVGSELAQGDNASVDENEIAARVAAYGKAEWSMPLAQLETRLANIRAQTIEIGTEIAKREVFARYPELEGTIADKLVPWVLDKLSAKLSKKLIETAADNDSAAMVLLPVQEVLTTLEDAAEREGEPELLSHAELRVHVVEVGLLPMVMAPVEKFIKGQRSTMLIAFVLLLLLVVGGIRLADYLIARRAANPPAGQTADLS